MILLMALFLVDELLKMSNPTKRCIPMRDVK